MRGVVFALLGLCLWTPRALSAAAQATDLPRSAAQEDGSALAAPWLDKMAALAGKPVEYDLHMTTEMAALDRRTVTTGHMEMLDGFHFRSVSQVEVSSEMNSEPQRISILSVADGTTLWMEVEAPNPFSGQAFRQVQRVSLDQLEQLRALNGLASSSLGGSAQDPVTQMRGLFERYYRDLHVERKDSGVVLTGTISPDFAKDTGSTEPARMTHFRVVLDPDTGFPLSSEIGDGQKVVISLKMSNLHFPKSFPEGRFSYTPPEGLPVVDLTDTLSRQRPTPR